ncbi:ninjurin-1 [Oncorhynchus tshawytscha]|uniref:Ninjurin-1-like n=1 Tax=Oncorhynchus tshawytscha TaxID=74940 RepID=A0A8C8HQF9_ONCTS|nr:ninjurin-1 [Oncorhynchus tshawytscha]XP_035611651.1 ninjurin-1-like isoform X1 [Oncorhynchus keta]
MDSEARANGEDITLNKLDDIEANHDRLDPSGKVYRMINMNHYATRKSVAQSMLDVALLMANSSQLKTVLYMESQYRFYKPLIVLLSMSITLQVVVGLLLVFIVKYDLNDVRKHSKLNMMNNTATVFVFFTVIINIFITALGFEGAVIGLPEPQSFLLTTEQNQTGGL